MVSLSHTSKSLTMLRFHHLGMVSLLIHLYCLQFFHYKSHVVISNFSNWLCLPETGFTYYSNEVKNEVHRNQRRTKSENCFPIDIRTMKLLRKELLHMLHVIARFCRAPCKSKRGSNEATKQRSNKATKNNTKKRCPFLQLATVS